MTMNAVLENRLLSRWAHLLPRAPAQLGDVHEADCELVPLGDGRLLALTIDAVDEELEALYTSAATAGRIAAVASLSDLAAVGAEPIGLLLSVSLPAEDATVVQALVAEGIADACREAGTFVLGGDTSDATTLRIACVGVGTVPASGVLRRVGLRPGDRLFASGPLGTGAALAGVKLLGVPVAIDEGSFRPPCRLAHGRALRGIASACIDTSDGLFAAVDQLARINGVAIELDAGLGSLLSRQADAVRAALGIDAFPLLASAHGEFELVFGVPPERLDALAVAARALDWRPVPLGRVEQGEGLGVDGTRVDGARIRNLLGESGGDVRRYVASLIEMGRALCPV
jgi:thiamine-monophosphate kinase